MWFVFIPKAQQPRLKKQKRHSFCWPVPRQGHLLTFDKNLALFHQWPLSPEAPFGLKLFFQTVESPLHNRKYLFHRPRLSLEISLEPKASVGTGSHSTRTGDSTQKVSSWRADPSSIPHTIPRRNKLDNCKELSQFWEEGETKCSLPNGIKILTNSTLSIFPLKGDSISPGRRLGPLAAGPGKLPKK